MASHVRNPAGWLVVRQRRIVGAGLAPEAAETVFCPFSDETKEIDACFTCGFCDGVTKSSHGRPALLLCTRDMSEAAALSASAATDAPLRRPIADLLRAETTCVRPDTTLNGLADLFEDGNLSAAVVVDDRGKPLGVVTQSDVLRAAIDELEGNVDIVFAPARRGGTEGLGGGFHLDGERTVREIMSRTTFGLPETAPIGQAAALMSWEAVRHLVVTRANGDVVGVLSSLDVLRWLAKLDGYVVPDGKEAPEAVRRR